MRPKKHETTGTGDLFRARLEQIINMKHELVQLAEKFLAWLRMIFRAILLALLQSFASRPAVKSAF
jgi:hypothetical protein